MIQVTVAYNPYRLKTKIELNRVPVPEDSKLIKLTHGKRLQEWISEFPTALREFAGNGEFSLNFYGLRLDYEDFEQGLLQARDRSELSSVRVRLAGEKSGEEVRENVISLFERLRKTSPIEDFRDPRLQKAFDEAREASFPITVIATMSAGKSTLINALLHEKLMPSKNEACTATITEILDNDGQHGFRGTVYGDKDQVLEQNIPLNYEKMKVLNDREDVHKICVEGNIPFLSSRDMALKLIDTPGPNNSRTDAHRAVMHRAIMNHSNSAILYVINMQQLRAGDDSRLLQEIAEQMSVGTREARDRFLFVLNRMDAYDPDGESVSGAIEDARKYLEENGIREPRIFPCSSLAALGLRTELKNLDIENVTAVQKKGLTKSGKDALTAAESVCAYDDLHLERYSTLSPSAQAELSENLVRAEREGNTVAQALIHSGIYSVEAAITAYVKKYAQTANIRNLVDIFYDILKSNEVITRVKTLVAADEKAAEALKRRAAAMQAKIEDGREAKKFQIDIGKLNPMPKLNIAAKDLLMKANDRMAAAFEPYGDTLTSREEAQHLLKVFAKTANDIFGELAAKLDAAIDQEVVQTGTKILEKYLEKLKSFDETAGNGLNFSTEDLIGGSLSELREDIRHLDSPEFISGEIDSATEVTVETKTVYEKVGETTERRVTGVHKEKTGTQKVFVRMERSFAGKETVENTDRKWYQFWKPKTIEKSKYVDLPVFRDEDVYEMVQDFEDVVKPVFESREIKTEHVSIDVAALQGSLTAPLDLKMRQSVDRAMRDTEDVVKDLKKQFSESFRKLDLEIQKKYLELKRCATDSNLQEKQSVKNRQNLEWLEARMREIDSVLEVW